MSIVLWNDEPTFGWSRPQKGLQEALSRAGVRGVHRQRSGLMRGVGRAMSKAGLVRPVLPWGVRRGMEPGIVTLTWGSAGPAWPEAWWREVVPWVFDCWPPGFAAWEGMLRRLGCRRVFFSARGAAEHFGRVMPGVRCRWLAEAVDPAWFDPGPGLTERGVKVAELGRKHEVVHGAIREALERRGHRHLFSTRGASTLIFDGLDGLRAGLADTAVLLCYPKSMTHPESAGGLETATQRYFEGLASRCLLVGHCPRELEDLMGFSPVVPLDPTWPTERIAAELLRILEVLGSFQGLVDTAYERFREVGTFDARAREMLGAMQADGW